MKVRLAQWGNSIAVRLPKSVADSMSLQPGQEFELKQIGTELRIETNVRPTYFGLPYYSMEEMAEEMRRLGPENEPPFEDWGILPSEWPDDDWSDLLAKVDQQEQDENKQDEKHGSSAA